MVRIGSGNQSRAAHAAVAIGVVASILAAGVSKPRSADATAGSTASPGGRPNIILVVTDDQSITSLRYRIMPFFRSQLSDPSQRWTTFKRAYDNNPVCCPARATLLTGQYSHHNGVWCVEKGPNCGEALRERHTLATWLHSAGYRTGLFGKYLNFYPFDRGNYVPPGWDQWHAFVGSGGGTYYHYRMIENGVPTSYGWGQQDHSTIVLGNKAARFVSTARRPFFAYIATSSPHGPATAERTHLHAYDGQSIWHSPAFNEADVSDKPRWVRSLRRVDRGEVDQAQRRELASLLDVDSLLRQVFTAAQDRGVWDNTVVIYISDNGYSYGPHRWDNKRCPYEECVRVPLFIRDPRGGVTHSSGNLVSNVDIAPTIARLAGARPDIRQDGRSLVPLLRRQPVTWPENGGLLLEYRRDGVTPSWWGVHTRRYAYDELATGEKELYDLARDPFERFNLARRIGHRRALRRLHCRLMTLRQLPC